MSTFVGSVVRFLAGACAGKLVEWGVFPAEEQSAAGSALALLLAGAVTAISLWWSKRSHKKD